MKRFDTFGEYMFDLLFSPLKKGRRAVNQFAIFFRVIGREFDDLKAAIFRVRNEANVATASEVMLPVHGQDRDMPRLKGETAEAYRTRLSMKGIISEWGGTQKGIRYALAALGYEHAVITPFYHYDSNRWAEFVIDLGVGNKNMVKDFYAIFSEVERVKEGSSKLACIIFTMKPVCAIVHVGGAVGNYLISGIPEGTAFLKRSHTLHVGGTGVVYAAVGVQEDRSPPTRSSTLHTGGAASARISLPVPEDTAPPSRTTILRTGGVCTILSNL